MSARKVLWTVRLASAVAETFAQAIQRCLESIPSGKVATCGTIAEALGDVRSARAVAAWVSNHPSARGGHRVVRADGRPVLSDAHAALRGEGVRAVRGRVPLARQVVVLPDVGLLRRLREEQRRLAEEVQEEDDFEPLRTIGGVDVAYEGETAYAAAVRLDAGSLKPVETAVMKTAADFPYIPSYLAYRELAGIEAVLQKLAEPPSVLLVDGHGRLHPARFGLACFVGVRAEVPTIGVAKHPLVGRPLGGSLRPEGEVPIEWEGAIRGYAWVPPRATRPVYVSVGHRVSLDSALTIVRRITKSRQPEPILLADRLSKERKKKGEEKVRQG